MGDSNKTYIGIQALIDRAADDRVRVVAQDVISMLQGVCNALAEKYCVSTKAVPAAAARARRIREAKAALPPREDTLNAHLVRALTESGKAMRAADLIRRIVELGYQFTGNPSSLPVSVYRVLRTSEAFRKVGDGIYDLAQRGEAKA